MLANLASVRIIHGKGTGVLRKAVQDELQAQSLRRSATASASTARARTA